MEKHNVARLISLTISCDLCDENELKLMVEPSTVGRKCMHICDVTSEQCCTIIPLCTFQFSSSCLKAFLSDFRHAQTSGIGPHTCCVLEKTPFTCIQN